MTLHLPEPILAAVRLHAREAAPDECVGLLFGRGDRITRAVGLGNVSSTPRTRFFADPQGLFDALKNAEGRGDTLLATYHSHPSSAAYPSPTDLAEAWPGAALLIVTPGAVRGFRIIGRDAQAVRLTVG